jgi:hypothetical protein
MLYIYTRARAHTHTHENGLVDGDTDIQNRVQHPVNGKLEYFSTLHSVGSDLTNRHVVDAGSVMLYGM